MDRSHHYPIGARKVDSQPHQSPVSEQSRPGLAQGARFRVKMTGANPSTFRRPREPSDIPVALTIAGSDSGGGAGIQADLKTFAALGVHGASAITCVTAQNPGSIRDIQACDPRMVLRQIEAVFEGLLPAAVKTGMLFSREIVRVAVEFFKPRESPPLIVDPVMVAT